MLIDIGAIVLGILFGIGIAILLIYLYVRGLVREVLDELQKIAENEMIGIVAEIENDVIYCYTEKDHMFVAQGKEVKEIRELIRNRFPGKIAYLAGGDMEAVTRLQAGLKDLAKEVE